MEKDSKFRGIENKFSIDKSYILDLIKYLAEAGKFPESDFTKPLAGNLDSPWPSWSFSLKNHPKNFFYFRLTPSEGIIHGMPRWKADWVKDKLSAGRSSNLPEIACFYPSTKVHAEKWYKNLIITLKNEDDWNSIWGPEDFDIKDSDAPLDDISKEYLINGHNDFNRRIAQDSTFTPEHIQAIKNISSQTAQDISTGKLSTFNEWKMFWYSQLINLAQLFAFSHEARETLANIASSCWSFFFNTIQESAHILSILMNGGT